MSDLVIIVDDNISVPVIVGGGPGPPGPPGSGGSGGVNIKDEGVTEATGATTINFTGAGVTATDVGSGQVDVAIPGGGGGVTDGDKGDITVSGSGATYTIDSNVISAYGRTLTVAANAPAARTVLGIVPGDDPYTPQDIDPLAGTGLTDATDSNALNAFFAYIGANNVRNVRVEGTYNCTLPITWTTNNDPDVYTRHVHFAARFNTIAAMDTLFTITSLRNSRISGMLELWGTLGSAGRSTRLAKVGLHVLNCSRSTMFDYLKVDRFLNDGVALHSDIGTSNSNFCKFGAVTANYCGSYWDLDNLGTTTYGESSTFSAHTRTGSPNATGQRSILTVANMPDCRTPTDDDTGVNLNLEQQPCYLVYNGELYTVTKRNLVAGTIEVFPWLPSTVSTGTVYYVYGHGFFTWGPNAGIVGVRGLECQYNGIALGHNSLYGGSAMEVGAQHCTVGWTFGWGLASGSVHNIVTGLYVENTFFDIVQVSQSGCQATLVGPYEIGSQADRLLRTFNIAVPRDTSAGEPINKLATKMDSLTILGKEFYLDSGMKSGNLAQTGTVLEMKTTGTTHYDYKTNTISLVLAADPNQNRLYGSSAIHLTVWGTGTNAAPTGSITLTPQAGWTINGGSSAVFSGFAAPAQLNAYADFTASNWVVGSSAVSTDPRVQSITSATTATPTFLNDLVKITALAVGFTLNNPTGTAIEGHGLVVRIKDNGVSRTIAYGTQYRGVGVTLPTSTVPNKTLYLGMIYNLTDTKWDVTAVAQEA